MSDPSDRAPVLNPTGTGGSGGDPKGLFDAARFREVLGHFPTGVTVVTTMGGGQPLGLAVGSFCSVSLEPPLVLFCPDQTSATMASIRDANVFCVNVLAHDQDDVCRVFAGKGMDKFAGIGWRAGVTGCPVIHGALAWIDCHVEEITEAGDHFVVLGRVLELGVNDDRGGPLLFYRGGFGRFEP